MKFIEPSQVLTLSREGLAGTGPAVAEVTARAVDPLPGTFAGLLVRLDGAEPLDGPAEAKLGQDWTPIRFNLRNTGAAAPADPEAHPAGAVPYLDSDVYRLSVSVEGEG